MRYAILDDNGVVINVIEANKDFGEKIGAIYTGEAPINIGSVYLDNKFKYVEEGIEIEIPAPAYPTETVLPTSEERLAALEAGLLALLEV